MSRLALLFHDRVGETAATPGVLVLSGRSNPATPEEEGRRCPRPTSRKQAKVKEGTTCRRTTFLQ